LQKNYQNTPIFIISKNRLSCLKQLIEKLEKYNLKNIYILDNASTYEPLLTYLDKIPYNICKLNENLGHLALWKCKKFDHIIKNIPFILTDPDVIPIDNCPDDFIYKFYEILEKYQDITKVGFSLKIDNLPDSYNLKETVMKWEMQFWQNKITSDFNFNIYRAKIDTTFALYKPNISPNERSWFNAVRTGGNYMAEHTAWYSDSSNLTGEEKFYIENASSQINNWAKFNKNDSDIFNSKKYIVEIDANDKNSSHFKKISYIENNSKVLDVGCANGDFGYFLINEKNCEVTGIDYNFENVKKIKEEKLYKNVFCMDLDNLEINSFEKYRNYFDHIVCGDVIEHIKNPFEVLKVFKSLLNENGTFVFSVPNISHGSIKLNLLKNLFEYTSTGLLDDTHIKFFTLKNLINLMNLLELQIENLDRIYKDIDKTEQKINFENYPKAVIDFVEKNLESYVYQYIIQVSNKKTDNLIENNNKFLEVSDKQLQEKHEILSEISIKNNIQKRINEFSQKYKDKKILIYGAGLYFIELNNIVDFSGLNIVGISDKRFKLAEGFFEGYPVVSPEDIKDIDVILVSILNNYEQIVKSLNIKDVIFESLV